MAGGLASSTATTLVYARHGSRFPALVPVASAIVLVANLVVLARLAVMGIVVAPDLKGVLLPVLAIAMALGLAGLAIRPSGTQTGAEFRVPELQNPTNMRVALGFGLLYGLVLLGSAWTSDLAGSAGLYAIAAVSGLADVDAVTLSSLAMFNSGRVRAEVAVRTIGIAFVSATAFKIGVLALIGGRAMVMRCGAALVTPLAGLAVGLILFA